MAEQSRAMRCGWKRHALELARRRGQAVDARELGIEEAVLGSESIHEVAVVPHEISEQQPRLLNHHRRELGRELRIPAAILHGSERAIEPQPLGEELVDCLSRGRLLEHAPCDALESFGRSQLALRGGVEEGPVRHRVPQKIGEPVCNRVLTMTFHVEQKLRRLQHRLDEDAGAFEEVAGVPRLSVEQRRVARDFSLVERSSKRARAERANEQIAAFHVVRAGRFAWDQTVDVAGAEGVERQLLGGGAVRFGEERRHALRAQLVLESVDEVFRRKPIRRPAVVAQQIADGIVVLTMREPPETLIVCRGRNCRREPFARRGDCRVGKLGEMTHPFDERLLLERARPDADASGVAHAIRRLVDQERLRWIRTIDQRRQGDAERLDVVGAGVRLRKMQSRRRRDAVVGMAAAALSGFEDRIHRPRKRNRSRHGLLRRNFARGHHGQCGTENDDDHACTQTMVAPAPHAAAAVSAHASTPG